MSITYLQAKDEIFGVVNAAFLAAIENDLLGLNYLPKLYFPGVVAPPPDASQIYGNCYLSVVTEHQASLSSIGGVKQYETIALFSLQLFTPKQDSRAFRIAEMLGSSIRDAFRLPSPSGEVWFRSQRLSQVTGTDTKNQINVVVTCIYQTIQ